MEAGVGRAEFRLIFVEMGDEVGDGIGGGEDILFFIFLSLYVTDKRCILTSR